MIHRWSISSHPSESVARLYSNRDIALRGPDLCSSVMWLRVMIRDRIFSSLDRAVQPEFFRRWGGRREWGSGRGGGNCRADGSLSRNVSGWNNEQLDRKSADRFVSTRHFISLGGFAEEKFLQKEWFSICVWDGEGMKMILWFDAKVLIKFCIQRNLEIIWGELHLVIYSEDKVIIKEYRKSWCLFIKLCV